MNKLNIYGVNEEQKKILFKIFREIGYKIGRCNSSDEEINRNFLICKEEKVVFYSYEEYPIVYFKDVKIIDLIKWMNNEGNDIATEAFIELKLNAFISNNKKTIDVKIPQEYFSYKINYIG